MLCVGSACASVSRLATRARKSHDSVALEFAHKSRGSSDTAAPCTQFEKLCASISLRTCAKRYNF